MIVLGVKRAETEIGWRKSEEEGGLGERGYAEWMW